MRVLFILCLASLSIASYGKKNAILTENTKTNDFIYSLQSKKNISNILVHTSAYHGAAMAKINKTTGKPYRISYEMFVYWEEGTQTKVKKFDNQQEFNVLNVAKEYAMGKELKEIDVLKKIEKEEVSLLEKVASQYKNQQAKSLHYTSSWNDDFILLSSEKEARLSLHCIKSIAYENCDCKKEGFYWLEKVMNNSRHHKNMFTAL